MSAPGRPPRPEVLAFLQEIKEQPLDDTPRLVLADWLEEHDDPRGELIRLGCTQEETLRRPESWNRDPYYRLRALRRRYAQEWVQPLLVLAEYREGISFERGLTRVAINSGRLCHNTEAEALLGTEALSWVEAVRIWIRTPDLLRGDVGSPLFPHFTVLDLNCFREDFNEETEEAIVELVASRRVAHLFGLSLHLPIGDRTLRALAASPHLGQLRRLALHDCRATAAGLQALCASPHLVHLAELELSNDQFLDDDPRFGDQGARFLAESPLLGRLLRLRLSCANVGDAGVTALARARGPIRLTHLALDRNRFGAAGAAALASSPLLAGLTHLDLAVVRDLRDAAIQALAASPHLTRLTHLNLFRNHIGPAGLRALAASPSLAGLTHLNLEENEASTDGAEALANSVHLTRLVEVDLSHNQLSDGGARVLAGESSEWRGRFWSWLQRRLRPEPPTPLAPMPFQILRLRGNGITADGIQALAASSRLASVCYLDLSSNPIGDTGLIALANSPHLGQLTSLVLHSCRIGAVGLQALADSPHLPRLAELRLGKNSIPVSSVLALAASPQRTCLTRLTLPLENWHNTYAEDLKTLVASPHLTRFSEICLDWSPSPAPIDADMARAIAALFGPPRPPLTVCLSPYLERDAEQPLREMAASLPGVEIYQIYHDSTWSGTCLES